MKTIKEYSLLLLVIIMAFAACGKGRKSMDGIGNSNNIKVSDNMEILNKKESSNKKETNRIFPKGNVINNDYFSGTAWLQMLVTDKKSFDMTVGNVLFEPGCRNNWHSHPGGQILLCTKGTGYYQEKGKPIQLLSTGDVVEIRPDIIHWHGATPDCEFEHIAISPQAHKGAVTWMEPVTDQEYNSYTN